MATFDELRSFNDALIRKALSAAVFVAPQSVDDEVAALKDATGLLALPTGYNDVGRITSDGITFPREVETSDTTSLGASQPTRRDIVSDVSSISFVMQESKREVFELYDGIDLGGVVPDADGNVSYDRPDRPAQTYHRLLAMFKDGEGVDAVYGAVWMPRALVTDRSERVWNSETEIQYSVTLTAFVDPTVGTAVRTLWAGSPARLAEMGFAA